MIENVKNKVFELLNSDCSGHGIDHITRVLDKSLEFSKNLDVDINLVTLIALLHDVDDYKIFGKENAQLLPNATKILTDCGASKNIIEVVTSELNRFGYSKYLEGLRPITLEGKIVSDADMCDALGANGILRTYAYSIKNNKPFFDSKIKPNLCMDVNEYQSGCSTSSVNHLFEKILKLKDLMMTDPGKKEALVKHDFIVNFLYQIFTEENNLEWTDYLTNYLK